MPGETGRDIVVTEMTERLADSAGDDLLGVVLYGARAHGDYRHDELHYFLLVVLRDLDLATVDKIAGPVRWWLSKKKPYPRILSPTVIRDAADVFPIEFLDITRHHQVLFGDDPFTDLVVHTQHLRLQCERELREKLMRLQEAYISADGKDRKLRKLLVESYFTFSDILRGCLHLEMAAEDVPVHTIDAVRAFCDHAELDAAPFETIDRFLSREGDIDEPAETFASYYAQLRRAVGAIDDFRTDNSESDQGEAV